MTITAKILTSGHFVEKELPLYSYVYISHLGSINALNTHGAPRTTQSLVSFGAKLSAISVTTRATLLTGKGTAVNSSCIATGTGYTKTRCVQ